MSDKVTERHLSRQAMLYIRQSTPQQLLHNEESRRLQYAMRGRLQALGWRDVEVVDEDLGRSASGIVERSGFQRLVAQVSLGEVGAVGARELSRFARNSRDWQKLIEVCRYVDTLLVDQDTVYDARQSNDRLLLGLKGSLNEYELDLLRLRGQEARREKARRGAYLAKIAVGYRKSEDGTLEKTPDLRVQQAIGLVFDKVVELGSVRQCLLWFQAQGLRLPVNLNHRGVVAWKAPAYRWFHHVLTNPVYAGAYAYGRTAIQTVFKDGVLRQRVRRRPRDEWMVLLRDHHEAYIDWERFEWIQQMLSKNAQARRGVASGAAKKGTALLVGLLRCRRCGQKLAVGYSGVSGEVARYVCHLRNSQRGESRCISFSALDVDDRVGRAVIEVLRPAAIEASLRVAAGEASARDEVLDALRLERQAAQYAADRAGRQFDAVDPENRLVVDELERRWNDALARLRDIDERIEQHEQERHAAGEVPDPDSLRALGADVARVWNDASTDVRHKKRIVRTLVEEIIVDVEEAASEIVLVVHWKGGVHTELRVAKRRRGQNRAHSSPDVVEAVRQLALVCDDQEIAGWLNRAGVFTAKRNQWSRNLVAAFRSWRNIPAYSKRPETERWLTLADAARFAGLSTLTLRRAILRGVLPAEQPVVDGPWLIRREDLLRPETREGLVKRARSRAADTGEPASPQLALRITRT